MNRALLDADVRMLSVALIANQAIGRPYLITATGRAAPSRYAVVPTGIDVAFALMPGVDYHDETDKRPGAGFVGGRLSSFAPFLEAQTSASIRPLTATRRTIPTNHETILRELRTSAGLAWAPGALYALVGWEDEGVAAWADRLRDEYAQLPGRQQRERAALQRKVYGKQRPTSALAQASRWRDRAIGARQALSEIEALPVTEAARLLRQRDLHQRAQERAQEQERQRQRREVVERPAPSPGHWPPPAGRGL